MCATLDSVRISKWLKSGALLGTHAGEVFLGITRQASPTALRFYAPDYFLESREPWLFYESYVRTSIEKLLAALRSHESMRGSAKKTWTGAARDRFEDAFLGLQTEFKTGRLEKGVPYAFERTSTLDPTAVAHAIRSVLEYSVGRPVTPYGFWDDAGSGMLGCTPETLFRNENSRVTTMALAGTRRAVDTDKLPLLEDPKERREHQLVIDSIAGELEAFGHVHVGETRVVSLPTLSHLKTEIDLRPKQPLGFELLVRALHPTPALGAYPREQGWEWLRKLETQSGVDRGRFGAPFGAVFGSSSSLCVVAIRNIQWNSAEALLCAGCGVIRESEFEREWQELQGKFKAVHEIVSL